MPDVYTEFNPSISSELLFELAKTTTLSGELRVASLLNITDDQLKAARGKKHDRRTRYPEGQDACGIYFNALDKVYGKYDNGIDALRKVEDFLEARDLHIDEGIDELFADIDKADAKARQDKEQVRAWWLILTDYLRRHFKDIEDDPVSSGAPAASGATAPAPTAQAAAAPTLLRQLKGILYGAPTEAAAAGAQAAPALLAGRPLSDDDFVQQVLPPDADALLARHAAGSPGTLLDADPASDDLGWDAAELFASKEGLPFARLVERCKMLARGADSPAFFERMAALFDQLEAGSDRPSDMSALRGAFLRYADADMGRGLAFMLLMALVGPDKPRAIASVIDTPEAQKARKR